MSWSQGSFIGGCKSLNGKVVEVTTNIRHQTWAGLLYICKRTDGEFSSILITLRMDLSPVV